MGNLKLLAQRLTLLLFLGALLSFHEAIAQKFISERAMVTFYSEAPIEDIEASNTAATSIFDTSTGEIAFSIPIAEFQFDKSLMKKHFNENYMDTDQYPKSTFKGTVSGYGNVDGMYQATASGELSIHGKTKQVIVPGEVNIEDNQISINAKFLVALEDYDIKIPRILFNNIAETVEVTIDFIYKPYVTK